MENQDLTIRPATPDDWDATFRLLLTAFHDAFDEDADRIERTIYEPERSLVATDDGQIVANAGVFTRDMSVPGAVVPAAHVTMVSVAPTYRRRGLLRRLMQRQLREVADAGREPIAALWASEGRIYQRFGYGLASQKLTMEIDSVQVRLPDPGPAGLPARLRMAEPASVRTELAKVYEQLRPDRPGWSSRDDRWWEYVLRDIPSHRRGGTELRATLHEGQSGVDGYALWRAKSDWDTKGPKSHVRVVEFNATNPQAYLALWRFLLSVDLTRSVRYWAASVDEPLLYLADEPRRLGSALSDGLWVRVVDVGAALAARRYAAPIDLVFEVIDDLLPENSGRWRLTAEASGTPTCTRTDSPADLTCDVSALGAAYLGGAKIGALTAAGRLAERTAGAARTADAAFSWHRLPSAIEVF